MADDKAKDEKAEQGSEKKSSKKMLIFIILGVVLLGVLGVGGYFAYTAMTGGDNGKDPDAGDDMEQPTEQVESIKLLSAVDNFSLKDNRYIQFQLSVVVDQKDVDAAKQIFDDRKPQIKDALITMFMQRTSTELRTPEGSQSFKDEIRARLSEYIEPEWIKDILFDVFLIG